MFVDKVWKSPHVSQAWTRKHSQSGIWHRCKCGLFASNPSDYRIKSTENLETSKVSLSYSETITKKENYYPCFTTEKNLILPAKNEDGLNISPALC